MFEEMISAIQEETVRRLYSVRLRKNEEVKRERVAKTTSESVGGDGTVKKQPRKVKKIGRNLRQRQEVQELLRPGCVKIPGQEDCHGIS